MNEALNGNRRRPTSSALDRVDELERRLRDSTNGARALVITNRQLAARVASLERELADTGGLSDDELVAELPRRMARALESAQEVAEELVDRAQRRDDLIRQKTDQRSMAVLTHAEAEASAMIRRGAEEAVARVNEAKAQAAAIIRAAHAQHDQVMSQLQEESARLKERVRMLQNGHGRLVRAYEVVERTLVEAKGALRTTSDGDAWSSRPVPDERTTTGLNGSSGTQLYAVPADAAVYDWSPSASGTA